MEDTIKVLESRTSWKESMRKCCRINKLNIDIVSYYTPLRFRASYSKFQAIYEKKSTDKTERWIQNELKAFYWICVAISCINQVKIAQFTQKQWTLINEIFYFKQPLTLEYEGKKLVEDVNAKRNWTREQDQLLASILHQCSRDANKWNEFARRLYETSLKRYFRTGKQCRQRWLNHLDPSKKHGEWTKQQDIEVVRLFISQGKKWSQIARKLGDQRTQHMVKNRYKTILSKQKKQYPKIHNEIFLMKSFLDPVITEKYTKKEQVEQETPGVKEEHKSLEDQLFQSEQDQELVHEQESEQEENIEPSQKNLPHTSCAFELPQVYSPWYVNIPITPTFSPSVSFFMNLSSFSAFDANYSNQFYGARVGEKIEKIDQ